MSMKMSGGCVEKSWRACGLRDRMWGDRDLCKKCCYVYPDCLEFTGKDVFVAREEKRKDEIEKRLWEEWKDKI